MNGHGRKGARRATLHLLRSRVRAQIGRITHLRKSRERLAASVLSFFRDVSPNDFDEPERSELAELLKLAKEKS